MADVVDEVLHAVARGELVVVADDDDREGEGGLAIAASLCTAEKMAFIIRHSSGIVCAPITGEYARRLRLDPMVVQNESRHATAFTVSVDYKPNGGTGISAEERAACCRALANPNATADDFARPGHLFPLVAREGGVLLRSGHTEAAVDLCKLANLPPVGVISELMNDDGSVMRGEQVARFASQHKLKRVTIASLIAYRRSREKLIKRTSTFVAESPIGPLRGFSYHSPFDTIEHAALVYDEIGDGRDVLTRLHRPNVMKDLLSGHTRMQKVLHHFKLAGRGVLVYLQHGAAGVPIELAGGFTATEAERNREWREVGVGAQILHDLGITSIINLTSSVHDHKGLAGFGIEIVSTVRLEDRVLDCRSTCGGSATNVI